MSNSAIIDRGFYIAVHLLPPEEQGEAYNAYCALAMDGIEYSGRNKTIACMMRLISDKLKK